MIQVKPIRDNNANFNITGISLVHFHTGYHYRSLGLNLALKSWKQMQDTYLRVIPPKGKAIGYFTPPPVSHWLSATGVALAVKNLPANAGHIKRQGTVPGLGRSPGEGNGSPLQYSCLENPWTEGPAGLQSMASQRVGDD